MSGILLFVNVLSQKVCLNDSAGYNVIFGNGTRENDTIIYEDDAR